MSVEVRINREACIKDACMSEEARSAAFAKAQEICSAANGAAGNGNAFGCVVGSAPTKYARSFVYARVSAGNRTGYGLHLQHILEGMA